MQHYFTAVAKKRYRTDKFKGEVCFCLFSKQLADIWYLMLGCMHFCKHLD